MIRLLQVHSKVRTAALTAVVVFSLAWTAYDWHRFTSLKVSGVTLLGIGLSITEVCFIAGALLMAASIGIEVVEKNRLRRWFKHLRAVRREVKSLAGQVGESKLFAYGFWLNFIGAVGTSLLLIVAVFKYVPVAGWGLLVLLILDLIATFGWRIPLHIARKAHMQTKKITIRRATKNDIDGYLALQSERWEEDNMANREQLESRLRAYPQGMLVAESKGKIVGMVYAMRITNYDYNNPPSWDEITHNGYCDNADLQGAVIFGVDLSTAKGVGHLAGDKLLIGVGRLAISEGVKTALLGGRLPGYHSYADKMTAEEYLWAKNEAGEPLDHQVKYYTSVPGLRAIKSLPNYFNDPDSLDYGVLLKWRNPLFGIPGKRLWAAIFPVLFRLEGWYLKLAK